MANNSTTRFVKLDGPSRLKGVQVARLTGREQISRRYYYFEHSLGKHELVLIDDVAKASRQLNVMSATTG